ncbi:hypothetical protein Ae201684_007708 [Aphanomyces euteiches]|uniref:Uncharacterized protein n=1 Tax=Aphanomyces euteiches TaxID=100861 RepID=A0A6G0X7U8_9STRA|nr:hypothetical protein Ae201684_007708 [Aphanomyces euteiches]KAH9138795.1 hypothetical protein AeRB84_016908 [Aphanomyces euteiches]
MTAIFKRHCIEDMEEEWNVMEDLQCLFTEDMRAEPRFGILDLFLDSTDSEGRTNRVIAAATKKKRIRTKVAPEKTAQAKRKREIIDLIHQITVLENQLIEKGRTVPARQGMSTWENAAREEFFAQAKALQKNAQLKRDVSEQTAFIKQITQLLRTRAPKAFRSLDLSGYAWQLCRLPAHVSERISAINSIAHRQFTRLEGAFINAGLYARSSDLLRKKKFPQPDGKVTIEFAYNVKLAAPCHVIGAVVWKILSDKELSPWPSDGDETIEMVDPFTMYRTYSRPRDGKRAAIHANMVFKYFAEAERQVIVWRSILDDELLPEIRDGHVHDEPAGLIFVHCLQNLVNLLCSCKTAITIFEKVSFSEPPFQYGKFPKLPPKSEQVILATSLVKQTIIRRGLRLELMFETGINNVVKSYRAGLV